MAFLILVIGDLHIPDRAIDIPAKFKKLLAPGKIAQTLCLGNLTDRATYESLRRICPDLKVVRGRSDVVDAAALPLTQVIAPPGTPPPGSGGNGGGGVGVGGVGGVGGGGNSSSTGRPGGLRIGMLEGFTLVSTDPDLLLAEANRLDVDVLCWSGATHRFDAFEYMDKFFVNPGSATGAFTTNWPTAKRRPTAENGDVYSGGKDGTDADGTPKKGGGKPAIHQPADNDADNAVNDSDNTDEEEEVIPSFCLMDVQGISLTLYVYQLRKDANGVETVAVEKVQYTKPVEPTASSSSSS